MSTRTGFPRMDWDTGFLADPKFLHLRDLLPDPIQFGYAGFCYLRLAADAWRTCERHPIGDVVRGIEPWAGDALRDAGLIDEAYRIPDGAYDKWVGSGIMAREVWKEAKRKHRDSAPVSRTPQDSAGLSGSQQDPRKEGRERREDPKEGTDGTEGVQGEDAVWTFLAKHHAYIREDAPLGRRLVMLLERRGAEAVMAEAVRMSQTGDVLSDRQWVLGLENALEQIPSGRVAADAALASEAEARNGARSEQIARRVWERRMEEYRHTGTWRPEWGDKPADLPEVVA